jgi:glucose/arabinose dehydrogenase
VLPPPEQALIPVVNVVTAKGWTPDATPTAADGLTVHAFARGLNHPRWVYVLPNGDVLVAETNAPARPDDAKGIKGFFFRFFQKKAGGAVPSANRITLLRDTDGDGVADIRTVFLSDLHSPFGMALAGNTFYVANTDALVRFPYTRGETRIPTGGTKVTGLPGGRLNHHWTKNVIARADGSKLYVAVGSNSNAGENGIGKEEGRAAIWEIDPASGRHRIFASGLRNPVGLAWEPSTSKLWAAVNERDELGSDLVPDYITSVRDGGFYGWPYSYYGKHIDSRVAPQRPDLIDRAIVPEVIFVPFVAGHPAGEPVDVLTGFVRENGEAMGRPVGVAMDRSGALLVADDVGNVIWRVTRAPPQ